MAFFLPGVVHGRAAFLASLLLLGLLGPGCVNRPSPPRLSPIGSWVLDEGPYRAQAPVVIARDRAAGSIDGSATRELLTVVSQELDEIALDHARRAIVYRYQPDGTLQISDKAGVVGFGRWQLDGLAVDLAMEQPEAYQVRGIMLDDRLVMQPVPESGDRIEYFTSFFRRGNHQ